MVNVPGVVSLPKLTELELYDVIWESDEDVLQLISGCPVLHSLTVERIQYDNVLVYSISSPTLRHLWIHFTDDYDSFTDEHVYQLEIDAP